MSGLWPRMKAALFGGGLQNPDSGSQSPGPARYDNDTQMTVSDERAMSISAVFACVRLLTQSGANLPLHIYRKTEENRELLDDTNDLVRIFKYKPNQYMTAKQFRSAMWASRVMWGNAYAERIYSGTRLVGLLPLKPGFMEVDRTNTGLLYKYSTDNGVKVYRDNQIFHWKGSPSFDGCVGISPIGYMRYALGVAAAADRKAATSFGGRPSGILKTESWPNQEQREQLRSHYSELGTDGTGDGSWWLLPGDLSYQSIGLPPDDLQLLESRNFNISEICRFYGVPVVMVDGSTGSTAAWPASYEQQVLSFMTFTMKGYLEEFEDAFSTLLGPTERRRIYAEHSVEGFLRTDSQSRAAYYSTALQNGWLSRNEVRKLENLAPIEGGDKHTVQLNLTDIEDLPDMNGESNAPE